MQPTIDNAATLSPRTYSFKCTGFSPCDHSEQARSWTALVDDFFTRASGLVAELGLNVEFVLDGCATPGGDRQCLSHRYGPLKQQLDYGRSS